MFIANVSPTNPSSVRSEMFNMPPLTGLLRHTLRDVLTESERGKLPLSRMIIAALDARSSHHPTSSQCDAGLFVANLASRWYHFVKYYVPCDGEINDVQLG